MRMPRKYSIPAQLAVGIVGVAVLSVATPADAADRADAASVTAVRADGPNSRSWPCVVGYPCLYDLPHGQGVRLERIGCGFHDYRGTEFDNWADSARTYANTVTVFNYNSADGKWENYGTIPAWREWEFERRNVIDGVLVNC